jgi:single-stranded-DNA-specific exonuclease
MIARWEVRPFDPARIEGLSQAASLPPLLAQLLLNRGVETAAQAREFLEARQRSLHDPELLPGVVDAADRIVRAIRASRPVVVYGDYDVDGVCGTTLLWACLRLAGAKRLSYYIPHRLEEGYGVSAEALGRIATENPGALIITVDCGITAVGEARLARELGLELIVTDHHTLAEELPEAAALVHPRLPGTSYPFPHLCGCGVAFKLAWQVCKQFGDGKKASPHLRDFLIQALNLVALATVADVVPIEGENRIFVRHGLRGLSGQPSLGLRALIEVSGHLDKSLNTGHIGFGLAPRINAAGRLERASMAVRLLTTEDPDEARRLAAELDECNRRRQEIEANTVAEAKQMVEAAGGSSHRGSIVLGHESWHPGVIGIVAGRLMEIYHRPTVIVALGEEYGQGSARSIPGFDLYEALKACSQSLVRFGGHAAAAGLRVSVPNFATFTERFEQHCLESLTPEQRQKTLMIDAEVPLAVLTPKLVDQIAQMEPYGIGNPRPILMADQVRIVGEPRVVGERRNHLQFRFSQGGAVLKGIGWNMAERGRFLKPGMSCSVAFELDINEWQGRREVQLVVKDFQVRQADPQAQPA